MEVSIATSSAISDVADMDALSFVALSEVVARVNARHKYESSWVAMMAAQGTKEGMENITKRWSPNPVKTGDDFAAEIGSF